MCLLILIANNLRLLPSSQKGQTPLLLATRKNDRATVQELLAADVDVDYIEEVSVHACTDIAECHMVSDSGRTVSTNAVL